MPISPQNTLDICCLTTQIHYKDRPYKVYQEVGGEHTINGFIDCTLTQVRVIEVGGLAGYFMSALNWRYMYVAC